MYQGQPEMVADLLLRERHLYLAAVCQARLKQPPAQIQQQGGDPLLGITPAKSRHPIVQPALILPELKRDPQADGRILRDKLQQVPMIDHSEMRSGQALDRV